jgi:hypothetical protein
MHNKRIGRDDLLKIEVRLFKFLVVFLVLIMIQWARTPPSASWRFDSGAERDRGRAPPRDSGRRSPRGSRRSPSPRRSGRGGDYSPRNKDDRGRDRDYDRRDRGENRSRSPEDRLVLSYFLPNFTNKLQHGPR